MHRYAPDSAKPEDAKRSNLQDIKVGDQLRARGNRNADGTEITAEEIYTGVFPKFVGHDQVDRRKLGNDQRSGSGDKKTVQLKMTADSQLHKIPAEMAQRFAVRLKGNMPAGNARIWRPGISSAWKRQRHRPPALVLERDPEQERGRPVRRWRRHARAARRTFSRSLVVMPSSKLADLNLQKGDAVVILATEGTASSDPHSHHAAQRCRTNSSGRAECKPGHDAYAVEPRRRTRRRRHAVSVRMPA